MALLSIANLVLSFGDVVILDGVNLTLNHGEHVGLVGRNGCGKSTLMKLIAGLTKAKPDSGQVQLARGTTAGYLTQDPELALSRTLREEAASGFEALHKLHEELDRVSHEMAEAEGEALARLLKKYEKLEHEMHAAGGYTVDHEIDATLHGVGLGDETFNVRVGDLSGGQKGRLALAKLLLSKPDLLLLDEPTNHLDIPGRQWLEEYLAAYSGAVVVVSHDRWLLDRVATTIYELEDGELIDYPGNYHKYVELRRLRRLEQQRAFDKQQQRIKREQSFIDRYKAGQRAKQARGREKRLERFKEQESLEAITELDVMKLTFAPRTRCGDVVLTSDHLAKAYDGKVLFDDVSLTIKRGDRIGLIGPNGAGKSTLVNCFMDEMEPDAGKTRIGANVEVGHFKQTHEDLDLSRTVVEYLQLMVEGPEQSARDLAGAFLFSGDEQDKPLAVLSGGERARAVIAGLMAGGHNLLVLDEPTNHLDIPSAERLEEGLKKFTAPQSGYSTANNARLSGGGTLVLISHDRMLLDALVNQLLVFDGKGGVRHFIGNYSEYVATLAAEAKARQAAADDAAAARRKESEKREEKSRNGGQRGDGRGKPRGERSSSSSNNDSHSPFARMKQDKLEARIESIESQLADLDMQLADPALYRDGERVRALQQQRAALAEELGPLEAEWMKRAEASA